MDTAGCWVPSTTSMDCFSTFLKLLKPCPSGAWLQMNPQISQRWLVPKPCFPRSLLYKSTLPTLDHRSRCPRDSETLAKLENPELPHFPPPAPQYPTSHSHLPLTPVRLENLQEKDQLEDPICFLKTRKVSPSGSHPGCLSSSSCLRRAAQREGNIGRISRLFSQQLGIR